MPTFTVNPSRTAPGQFYFGASVYVPWDQIQAVETAIDAMQEKAAEGVAKASNLTAKDVRERIARDVSQVLTLDERLVYEAIQVTAEADLTHPAVQISISYEPEDLINYQFSVASDGVFIQQRKDRPAEKLDGGFMLGAEIFQREMVGGHRAGHLPIKLRHGQSVYDFVLHEPGFLDEQLDWAQAQLVLRISEVRNEIINGFIADYEGTAPTTTGNISRAVLFHPFSTVGVLGEIATDLFFSPLVIL